MFRADKAYVWEICRLGFPVVVANIAAVGRFFVATAIVAKTGMNHLAVLALVSSVLETAMAVMLGLVAGTGVLTAQHRQSGDGTKRSFANGAFMGGALGVLLALVVWNFNAVAEFLHIPMDFHGAPEAENVALSEEAGEFFRYYALGLFPFCLSTSLRFFLLGMGRVKFITFSNIIGFLVCVALTYAFVLGEWGAPRMLLAGFALATTISFWLVAGMLLLYILLQRHTLNLSGPISRVRIDWPMLREMFQLGIPLSIMASASVLVMTIVVFFMRKWGPDYLAAYQVVMQIGVLAMMWPVSLGESVVVIVGRTHTDDQINLRTLHHSAMAVVFTSSAVIAVLLLALHRPLLHIFLEPGPVFDIAVNLLFAMAAGVMANTATNVGFGILRGLKFTWKPMVVLLSVNGGLTLSLLLGIYYLTDWHGAALLWAVAFGTFVASVFYHRMVARTPRYRLDASRPTYYDALTGRWASPPVSGPPSKTVP